MLYIEEVPGAVKFKIRVQPRASNNQISGLYQDMLKVRLTAPPVDGEANKACIEFFSQLLSVPKSSIRLIAGEKGRTKTLEVAGVSAASIRRLARV